MRLSIAALLVCAPLLPAASFTNGQAARAEIGQYFFNSALGGPTNQVLAGPQGIAYANGLLFVADGNVLGANDGADSNNVAINGNRVLEFFTSDLPGPYTDLGAQGPVNSLCGVCGIGAVNVLGQVDFTSYLPGIAQQGQAKSTGNTSSMTNPSAVATDGQILAVADTSNNRVLIWKTIPASRNAPADLVLGQPNFTTVQAIASTPVNQSSMRAPQGLWIQNGRLFVADTGNNRVMVWNAIPTTNNQPCDFVLGQPNTYTGTGPASVTMPVAAANTMWSPVGVSSDGVRLFVADLGFNRVLIWNSLPTTQQQPADVVVGQADMKSTAANTCSSTTDGVCVQAALCPTNGLNSIGQPTFPQSCAATLNFPRFALSDGQRLFIADAGNDRVLIFNSIPTTNGASANIVLGQPDFETDVLVTPDTSIISTSVDNTGSADTIATPSSLAFDGTNLYVVDAFNRRVLVYTPADLLLSQNSLLNAASEETRQEGFVSLSGTPATGDTITITIQGTAYAYTTVSGDTLNTITAALIKAINSSNSGGGDPYALALSGSIPDTIFLSSKAVNLQFDTIALAATTSADVTATASGSYLSGGNGATLAPGTILELNYSPTSPTAPKLADSTVSFDAATFIPSNESTSLPTTLGGVEVFADGIPLPLFLVSPTQVKAQIPFEFSNRTTASLYVRTVHQDGSVTVTTPAPVIIAPANPGIFHVENSVASPPPAFSPQHQAGNPNDTVTLSITALQAGDVGTITVNGRSYSYTVLSTDTYASITSGLISAIKDPQVTASATGATGTIVLTAVQGGSLGTGIPIATSVTAASGQTSAGISLSANSASTCCSDSGTGAITAANPAQPGETILVYSTGVGLVQDSNNNPITTVTGAPYTGVQPNSAANSMVATVGGSSGTVVSAGLAAGGIGIYALNVELPSTLPSNPTTPLYVAQNAFISNTVTIPVGTPSGSLSTLIATPNPIPVSSGQTLGQTTISWNTSVSSAIQIRVGSPGGPMFATGLGAGSATTGTWVTDGMLFYLQDASQGTVTSASNTLAVLVVHLTTATSGGGGGGGTGGGGTTSPTPIFPSYCPASTPGTFWLANSQVTFSAQPGIIQVALGATAGQTTLTWADSSLSVTKTQVYVANGTNGILFAGGTYAGSATTGEWVTNGLMFFLQDNTNGNPKTSSATLACGTVGLQHTTASRGSLTALPSNIVTNSTLGQTTLSWTCSSCSRTQVRVGSPSGAVFAAGLSTGSSQTGTWVTNGMTFYLQDNSGGDPTNPNNTVASTTVHLQAPTTGTSSGNGKSGVITGTPNPAQYPYGGAPYTTISLSWTCGACSKTEIHVGSPSGTLFARAGGSGTATTGDWVSDGLVFYLQDASNGNVDSAGNTVATFTASVSEGLPTPPSSSNGGTISADPNPIPISGIEFGQTTLTWSCSACTSTEVHVGSPDGPLLADGLSSGTATTGLWVTNGMVFYLQNSSNGNATASSNTVATITVETVSQ